MPLIHTSSSAFTSSCLPGSLSHILEGVNGKSEEISPDAFLRYLRAKRIEEQPRSLKAVNDSGSLTQGANRRRALFERLESACAGTDSHIERFCRMLDVIEKIGYYNEMLPWLYALSEMADERLRSKAVKVLCRAVPKKPLIDRLLSAEDYRVRANAVEALWFHQTPDASAIFRSALSDPNHRVVVNALVGLYHQGDPIAMERLIGVSTHSSQLFRSAALWSFLNLKDERAVDAVKSLVKDPSNTVREKANGVLSKLLYGRGWQPRARTTTPVVIYRSY
jgi:hypothetical protein